MQVDLNTFNKLIQKPIIYILLISTSSTKHVSLWDIIKSQSDTLIINVEENKDLMTYLNVRILPLLLVYVDGQLEKTFTVKNISELIEYVNSRTI